MADGVPEGFELDAAPQGDPGFTRGRSLQEAFGLQPSAPSATPPAVPPGFELDNATAGPAGATAGPQVGLGEAVVRGIGDQPIIGPLISRAEAAKNALLAGRHPQETDISHAENWVDRYAENLLAEQERNKAAFAQHPIAANVANLGAGLAGGGALLKAGGLGARLLGAVPAGTGLAGRVAASAGSGAGINAIDAMLRGQDPQQAAGIGGGIGAALPVAGAALSRPIAALASRVASPTVRQSAEDLAARMATPAPFHTPGGGPMSAVTPRPVPAGINLVDEQLRATPDYLDHSIKGQYEQLNQASTAISPQAAIDGITALKNQLRGQNFSPRYQKTVFGALDDLVEPAQTNGQAIPFQDVHALSKYLRTLTGPLHTENQAAASFARQYLDDMLTKMPNTDVIGGNLQANMNMLGDVRKDYLRSMNVDRIQQAMQNAETAGGTISMANNLRIQARNLLKQANNNKLPLDSGTVQALTAANARSRGIPRALATLSMRHGLPVLAGGVGAMMGGVPAALTHMGAAHLIGSAAERYEENRVRALFDRALQNELNLSPSVQRYNAVSGPLKTQMLPNLAGRLGNIPGANLAQVPAQSATAGP
jgi:hypothetical protein